MSELHVSLLGSFQAAFDGRALNSFRTSKVQALLIHLLVEAVERTGQGVGREQAMTLLWPEMPRKSAQENLRQTLYQLRRAIPDVDGPQGDPVPFILSDRKEIRINPEARYELDVAAFTSLLEGGGPEELAAAVELYQGAFLADFYLEDSNPFEAWAAAWRSRLQRQVLDALDALAAHHLELGQAREAAAYARRGLEIDNLRESAHRQLMAALGRMGKRAEALRQYERCRALLREELGVAPSVKTEAVARAVRRGDRYGTSRGWLPAPGTPLIGRETELAEITALLLEGARLVSIVGPGGMGKTRLALEVARQLAFGSENGGSEGVRFIERVTFVNLAPLSEAEEMVPAVARALELEYDEASRDGLRQRLLEYLQGKALLLLLDNFEHLLEEATLLKEILGAARGVKLLVTSRERLRLQAEHVYPLSGLAYSQWTTPVEAARDPAVQLFLQRARRVRPAFRLRSEHLEPLGRIVERTEGMPLALILAAGWVKVLGPAQITAELARNLDFLEATHRDVPARQRSMRAVFGATWERLSEGDRAIFAALSVFRGGFTLEAAQAVTGATPGDLMRLADRSLVTRVEGGRFEVHELLRQFAGERLEERGDAEAVRDAHSAYYLEYLAGRLPELKGREQLGALDAIEEAFENVSAGWRWVCQRRLWKHFPAASESIYLFTIMRSQYLEGIELMETAHRAITERDRSNMPLVYAYVTAGWLSLLDYAGLVEEALARVPELEAVVEGLTNPPAIAYCQLLLGETLRGGGRTTEAIERLSAAQAYFQRVQEPFYTALALLKLGWAKYRVGQAPETARLHRRGLALARQSGDHYVTAALLRSIGGITWMKDGPTEAVESYYREAANLRREMGEKVGYAYGLAELANIPLWREGDLAQGRPLLEEALAIAEEQNVPHITAHVLAELTTHRLIEGDYEGALSLTEEVLTLASSHSHTWTWATFQRGIALLGLGKMEDAIRFMKLPLSRMIEEDWSGILRNFLPFLGLVLPKQARDERAAELVAHGLTHPHAPGRLEVDPLINRFYAELEEALGEERFAAAWERGKRLDTLAVATEVLEELESYG